MERLKIAVIGAGSRSFGPVTVNDLLVSDNLEERGLSVTLMDKMAEALPAVESFAVNRRKRLERSAGFTVTTDLQAALDGADFVVTAIEVDRYRYWAQDFHIPRKYGFKQVYGENGGPGGLFHALRNMGPMVEIARTMERLCPDAVLLNFANPEHKLCEALTRLTRIQNIGLCHGFGMGLGQLAALLEIPGEHLEAAACGINHFTFFQYIRDKRTGEDLYPRLREVERNGHWWAHWHELGLGRILFRRFGLWPSPGANHYGEYVRWAEEFVASELQYFYDPCDGAPWEGDQTPELVYSLTGDPTKRPWKREEGAHHQFLDEKLVVEAEEKLPSEPSGELVVPIIEALACGKRRHLPAVNVENRGAIPNLPDDMIVEVPADADADGVVARRMEPLPEALAAILRVQGSIHKLLTEAFAERSKDKLLQAVLLEPTVDSYRNAVEMVNEMLRLQASLLPELG